MIFAMAIYALGCASSGSSQETYLMPDYSDKGNADGASYAADGMHFRKPMPYRPKSANPNDFYFKRCSELGEEVYFSKTSYECSGL